jgi:hypothetical protein
MTEMIEVIRTNQQVTIRLRDDHSAITISRIDAILLGQRLVHDQILLTTDQAKLFADYLNEALNAAKRQHCNEDVVVPIEKVIDELRDIIDHAPSAVS